MKNRIKRLTALLLAMTMCMSLLSANVWAEESEPQEVETYVEDVETLVEESLAAQSCEESVPADVETEATSEDTPVEEEANKGSVDKPEDESAPETEEQPEAKPEPEPEKDNNSNTVESVNDETDTEMDSLSTNNNNEIENNSSATIEPQGLENHWTGSTTAPTDLKIIDGVAYYQIYYPSELAFIAENKGEWLGYNYMLANDLVFNERTITCNNAGEITTQITDLLEWKPIDGFTGIFDGNGHTISGIYVTTTGDAGLFTALNGDVYNLNVENSYVKGVSNVGGIAGSHVKTGGYIKNCTYHGSVSGTDRVGGIVGGNHATNIESCSNYGEIWGESYVAGIVGGFYAYGITNCKNYGLIHAGGDYIGGIAGSSETYSAVNCVNYGNVDGNDYVGGIFGQCTNAGVFRCGNRGQITGNNYVAGISGEAVYGYMTDWHSNISDSYNTGDIIGTKYIGGITGYLNYSDVSNCYSIGGITGINDVGAVIGKSESIWGRGTVKGCYYLKTESVNKEINGFGNSVDCDGIVVQNSGELFPICQDKNADPSYSGLYLPAVLTYDVNGGKELESKQKNVRKNITLGELLEPQKDNYKFLGWFDKKYRGTQITSETICSGDMTVFAHWEKLRPASKVVNNISCDSAFTKTVNVKKNQTFNLGASANDAPLSYKSSNKKVGVKNGIVTIQKGFVGKAIITISAAETTQYQAAQKQVTVTVNPSATQLSSVKWDAKKKTATAAWKKNTTGKGYEVQYSTDKKFKKNVKKVKVGKNSTVKTTIKGLKKGTWYFRIRTVNGKLSSGWSKVKTLKITK